MPITDIQKIVLARDQIRTCLAIEEARVRDAMEGLREDSATSRRLSERQERLLSTFIKVGTDATASILALPAVIAAAATLIDLGEKASKISKKLPGTTEPLEDATAVLNLANIFFDVIVKARSAP